MRRPPRSTRTAPLSPYTTLFRSPVTNHSELLKMAESLLRPVVVGVDTSNGEDFTVLDGLDASTNIHIKDLGLELAGCARDGNRFVGGGRVRRTSRQSRSLKTSTNRERRQLLSEQSFDAGDATGPARAIDAKSEEHTSELQSLMRIAYAVFCLKKKHT